MEQITYREFREDDAGAVKAVALKSWLHSYSHIFTKDQIIQRNDRGYDTERLKQIIPIMKEGKTKFTLALNQSKVIGFAQIGYDWREGLKGKICLFRIYLDPDYIGQGIGRALLEKMEEFVSRERKNEYHLYVHRENKLGLNFYLRNQFVHDDKYDKEEGTEWFMTKKLSSK